jgi:hypothetical protein
MCEMSINIAVFYVRALFTAAMPAAQDWVRLQPAVHITDIFFFDAKRGWTRFS